MIPSLRKLGLHWTPFTRAIAISVLLVLTMLVLGACASQATTTGSSTNGDASGLSTSTGENLVGLAPGSITAEDYAKAQTDEPYAAKLADIVDQNRLGINFTWLLICGFLVMFMQAGFAAVETGFTRAKNALHTMSMNFMIYAIGIVGFFFVGFGIAFGGLGTIGVGNLGGLHQLNNMLTIDLGGHTWGIAGWSGFALIGRHV